MRLPFSDRTEAGHLLGRELVYHQLPPGAIVLALPRGGVPVGRAVADVLGVPLDVVVVRKLGVPWQPELAMGAVASGAFQLIDDSLVQDMHVSPEQIETALTLERAEVERRRQLYRGSDAPLDLEGRDVVLVDDGLATGSTMMVAARYVRSLRPRSSVVAVPVGSKQACRLLRAEADSCVCLATPEPFHAVGEWYSDFTQVKDSEVQSLLKTPASFA